MAKNYTFDVFNFRTHSFDKGSVTIPRTFDVGYYINARSGNYIVTLVADNTQRIEVLPACLRKLTGISPRTICGTYDFTRAELTRLGFVLPREEETDHARTDFASH